MTRAEIRKRLDEIEAEAEDIAREAQERYNRLVRLHGEWQGLMRGLPARERIDRAFGIKPIAKAAED